MSARHFMALAALALGFVCARAAEPSALVTAESTAPQILAACRQMLPTGVVTMRGSIVRRSRRGIPQCEYDFTLTADRTKTPAEITATFFARGTTNVVERTTVRRPGPVPEGAILKTDVTWLDLSLDFLWWPNAAFGAEREGESVHGQKCLVILVTPAAPVGGVAAMRLWTDRKTGCLMQAEQLDAAHQLLRRLWGTRVKKFGDRWMANVLEVESPASGFRTKITIEDIQVK